MRNTPRDTAESMTAESPLFIYATEMVSLNYVHIDLKHRSVLTLGGSGDQMLNAYFFGAETVTMFDINTRVPHYVELKMCAIALLSYDEFLSYFGSGYNDATFALPLYQRIRHELSGTARVFFDKLYERIPEGNFLLSGYFRDRSFLTLNISEVNAYLHDEQSFDLMKGVIATAKPKFIQGEFADLPSLLQSGIFDVINISNILDYFISNEGQIPELMSFLTSLATHVPEKGIICFYSYASSGYEGNIVPTASSDAIRENIRALGIFTVKQHYVTGIKKHGNDKVTLLIKK